MHCGSMNCTVNCFIFSLSFLPDAVAGFVQNVPALDSVWIESTSKTAAHILEKLDTDLKNYKSNSIKESIRLAILNYRMACPMCSFDNYVYVLNSSNLCVLVVVMTISQNII